VSCSENRAAALTLRAVRACETKSRGQAPGTRLLTNRHVGILRFLIRDFCVPNSRVSPFLDHLLVTTLNLLRNPNKVVLNAYRPS